MENAPVSVSHLARIIRPHLTPPVAANEALLWRIINEVCCTCVDEPTTYYPRGAERDLRRILCSTPAIAPAPAATDELPAWWDKFIVNIAELPDRGSPEGQPDMMLATAKELEACALLAMESTQWVGEHPAPVATEPSEDGNAFIIRKNVEENPNYCPYCLPCPGLKRMVKVEHLYWRCNCGAECDLRTPPAPVANHSENADAAGKIEAAITTKGNVVMRWKSAARAESLQSKPD